MTSPSIFWYRYRIDTGVVSPAEINRRWRDRYAGTPMAEVFGVVGIDEDRGLGALGVLDDSGEWWWEPGCGCSIVAVGDEERDRALLGFFVANLEAFAVLTYGPLVQGDAGFDVRLLASAARLAGDAP